MRLYRIRPGPSSGSPLSTQVHSHYDILVMTDGYFLIISCERVLFVQSFKPKAKRSNTALHGLSLWIAPSIAMAGQRGTGLESQVLYLLVRHR